MGFDRVSYIFLRRNQRQHTCLDGPTTQQTRQHNTTRGNPITTRCHRRTRRRRPSNLSTRNRYTLHQIRCSNGDVPGWRASLRNYDDRPLVERRVYAAHQKKDRRIHFRRVFKNADNATFPPRAKPLNQEPSDFRIWRVSFLHDR